MIRLLSAAALLFATAGLAQGPWAEGVQHHQQGRYEEAVQAFELALVDHPDDPELHYNLALSRFRAGKPEAAETAAEKAAALSAGRLAPLRDALLGLLRLEEAHEKKEHGDLQGALHRVEQAVGRMTRAALAPAATAAARRNLERALRLQQELDELQQQQEQQGGERNQQQQQEQEPQEQQQHEQDAQEQQGEEQQEGEQEPMDRGGSAAPQEISGQLSDEQRKKILDALDQFEQYKKQVRAAQVPQRIPGKKDW